MMICGGTLCGGRPGLGRLLNRAAEVTAGGVRLSWLWKDAPGGAVQARVAVAVDGEVAALVPSGDEGVTVETFDDGVHTVDLRIVRVGDAGRPRMRLRDFGRRAVLSWDAGAAVDLAGYRIYSDGGTGTVDTEEPVDTVTDIVVAERWRVAPDSGTGTGRISAHGDWTGEVPTNVEITIAVSGGSATWAMGGVESSPVRIARGQLLMLSGGVLVVFEDEAESYEEGDTWTIHVGPDTSWMSDELAEGTHLFAVAPVDAAGNEGSLSGEAAVVVMWRPEPVEDLAASWDGEEIALMWSLPVDARRVGVAVYANQNIATGALEDAVIESGPWALLGSTVEGFAFTPEVSGEWKFYVRPVDAEGRAADSIELVGVDTLGLSDLVELSEPVLLSAVPSAGGAVVLTWLYDWDLGEDLFEWRVYANEDPESLSFETPFAVIEAGARDGAEPWSEVVETVEGLPGPRWVTVRAADEDGNETTNTDALEVTPDSDAPAGVLGLRGGAG